MQAISSSEFVCQPIGLWREIRKRAECLVHFAGAVREGAVEEDKQYIGCKSEAGPEIWQSLIKAESKFLEPT